MAFAQPAKLLEPTKPLLRRAPAFASWTVTLKYPEAPVTLPAAASFALSSDRIANISITKTNTTFRHIATTNSGKKSEKWIFEGIQLMTAPDMESVVVIPAPAGEEYASPDYSDYAGADFEGMEWISVDTFKGVRTYDGKQAFLFETTKGGAKYTAFLSVDTQLPVYFSDGEITRTYVFNSPPSSPLTPPAKFMKVLAAHKKGIQLLKRNPSLP